MLPAGLLSVESSVGILCDDRIRPGRQFSLHRCTALQPNSACARAPYPVPYTGVRMTPTPHNIGSQPPRRRYVVHLSCVTENGIGPCYYIARIRALAARAVTQVEAHERVFTDECALIATINPLLPSGSDVRDVFSHVESPDGFFYILCLSGDEARQLGWRG
jgi:hypothetical protein